MATAGEITRDTRTLEADVAVVGAGMAGLAAALELRARRGARSWCWRRGTGSGAGSSRSTSEDGNWVDVGGQWVGPTQDRL